MTKLTFVELTLYVFCKEQVYKKHWVTIKKYLRQLTRPNQETNENTMLK